MILEDQYKDLFQDFLVLAKEHFEFEQIPEINFVHKFEGYNSFGGYDSESKLIHLAIANRHPLDILRTLAHELVHHSQDLHGRLYDGAGETGSEIENEANAVAGVVMRKFNHTFPQYFDLKPIIA